MSKRTGRPPNMERRAQAAKLRDAGKTYREIAEAMGCSLGRAHQLVNPAKKVLAEPADVQ